MTKPAGHTLNPVILRAYDIRGIVGSELSEDGVFCIGRAFAAEMAAVGATTAAVGYDGRYSSPGLEDALIQGLTKSGIHVYRVGRGPSPLLYFAVETLGADAGLMVTGSHNPPDFNGIKMTLQGQPYFGSDIERIGERVARGDFIDGVGTSEPADVFAHYVDRLVSDYRGEHELRVAWDPGNGAAGEVVSALVARLPGRHFVINDEIDGGFPAHHPDPTDERNLQQLRGLVLSEACDLGLAFDGDGDRIGVIDATGRTVLGDQLLVILAEEVLADMPGATILCDVKASRIFTEEIRRLGGVPAMWKAGHSHIKSKMAELDAPLAGELSAHIFFKHRYYGFDDAAYAAVRLISLLASSDRTIGERMDAMPKFFSTSEIRLDCEDGVKFGIVDRVAEILRKDGGEVIDLDGLRVEREEGWWLLRASNTQPMLVVRCEATTAEGFNGLIDEMRTCLEKAGISIDRSLTELTG